MDREILFKAKHEHVVVANKDLEGQWVEGLLWDEEYIYSKDLECEMLLVVFPAHAAFCCFSLRCSSNEQLEGCSSPAPPLPLMHNQILSTLIPVLSHLLQMTADDCCHSVHRNVLVQVFLCIFHTLRLLLSIGLCAFFGDSRLHFLDSSIFSSPSILVL